jgi:hypothetical protein
MSDPTCPRAFKTGWFAKAAKKAKVSDTMLCKAIAQVIAGQADDLGGGVFKKRLSSGLYRSIILARGGEYWVYQYLYAKQDRANIDDDELKVLRGIAKGYAELTESEVSALIVEGKWIEICQGFFNAETR